MSKKEPNSTNVNIMKFLIHFNRKKNKKNKKGYQKTFIMDNYSVLTHIMLIILIYKIKPFEQKNYFRVSNCDF